MTTRGTLGLRCVHIAQLMTHPIIYTLPFTLQLFYKPPGIMQRTTKSQKVYMSSHDGYKHFIPLTLVDIGPRVFQGGCRVAEICMSQKPCKIVRKT